MFLVSLLSLWKNEDDEEQYCNLCHNAKVSPLSVPECLWRLLWLSAWWELLERF